ncbi:hypothetical protein B7494_g4706 [Chlorociboria aeruginascens]|nr:hypothetical protein B7494_g4706 [Chlorociboria aeruginascens]
MTDKASKDTSLAVSHSTDWLNTPLTSFAPVDSALRCQVCKDFYTTPMITSCSHTFCSLCIRRCLNNDGKCPTCRTPDQELRLRCNWALEEVVDAFKVARPNVLDHVRNTVDVTEVSPRKKRKQDQVEADDDGALRKRTRSGGRRLYEEPVDAFVVEDSEDDSYEPDRGLTACPICQGPMTVPEVEAHIDKCNGVPPRPKSATLKQKSSKESTLNNGLRPERLAQLNYSMVKDTALRKKLGDMGISAGGSRQLMERRYTEWVTLWNANCDSKNPRSKSELRKELDVWERTQGSRAFGPAGSSNMGAQIKDKDFDGAAWSSKHDDSFRQLIASARNKPPMKASAPEPDMSNSLGRVDATLTHASLSASSKEQAGDPAPESDISNGTAQLPLSSQRILPLSDSDRDYVKNLPSQNTYLPDSSGSTLNPPPASYSQYQRSQSSADENQGMVSDIANIRSV